MIFPLDKKLTCLEDTVSYMIVITSQRLIIERCSARRWFLCPWKKEPKESFNMKSLHIMDMELLRTVWEMCTHFSQNLQKLTWPSCLLRTNTYSDLRPEWSQKIEMRTIANSSSPSSAEMIPSKFIKMLIKTQVYGAESSWKGRNILLTIDTWLIRTSKLVVL